MYTSGEDAFKLMTSPGHVYSNPDKNHVIL
jgi:hypothetical protein